MPRGVRVPLLLLLTICGCRLTHVVEQTTTGAPQYERAHIVYRIDEPDASLVGCGDSRPLGPVQPAGHREVAATHASCGAIRRATLQITAPHPDAVPGAVLVTLVLEHGSAGTSAAAPSPQREAGEPSSLWQVMAKPGPQEASTSHVETWTLTLRREELDLLLVDLAHAGFFGDSRRPAGRVDFEVELDAGRRAKSWTAEPRMQELITRVLREGAPDARRAGETRSTPPSLWRVLTANDGA